MDIEQFLEENKIYIEDLNKWVVPVDAVRSYTAEAQVGNLTEDLKTLQQNLKSLDQLFLDISNLDKNNG